MNCVLSSHDLTVADCGDCCESCYEPTDIDGVCTNPACLYSDPDRDPFREDDDDPTF